MKNTSIVILRCLSMFTFLTSLYQITPTLLISPFWDQPNAMVAGTLFGYLLMPLLISWLLWFFAERVSSFIWRNTDESRSPTNTQLLTIAWWVVSLYLILDSISRIVGRWFTSNMLYTEALITLMIGMVLVVVSRYVMNWLSPKLDKN